MCQGLLLVMSLGANIAICLVALGVGALIAPLPFGRQVQRYAWLSLPLGAIATAFVWDGRVDRLEGGLLVGLYILYVALIWRVERRPPALGETEELAEAQATLAATDSQGTPSRVGKDLLLVLAGVAAMAVGATLLVEAVRQISHVEATQTKLGLTLVGFATAFELVVLAWSASRRGASEAVVAGVVGSFAYNVTMTLGAAAIARPLQILNVTSLHTPLLLMLASLVLVLVLAVPSGSLPRLAGGILLAAYPVVVLALLF